MNVLFVNTNRIRPPVGPIAIDYIGGVLRNAGHTVGLLDLCWNDDEAAAAKVLADASIDAVAATFRNTDDCYYTSGCSFVPMLRDDVALIRRHYEGPLVLGGCGFSVMPEQLLEQAGAEYGLVGEGEVGLPAFLAALQGTAPHHRVPGLVFRGEDGRWQRNPTENADLAATDLSGRDTIDNARYFREGGQAGIETKRGCPGRCVYCADPVIKGHTPRLRPPADIVREMRNLLAQGADHFHLCDSEFNVPRDHASAVCQAIIDAGLGDKIRWYTYASPGPLTDELVALMKRAGCAGINFGVDSGSDDMLRALGRDFTAADVRRAALACRDGGMVFMFDLLLGAPGETWRTVAETVTLMKALEPDRVGISLGVRVYPGTPLAHGLAAGPAGIDGLIGNPAGTAPSFYVSPHLGPEPEARIRKLVGPDPRFLVPVGKDEQDYNYNNNAVLQQAIRDGLRGAYWDILRRVAGA